MVDYDWFKHNGESIIGPFARFCGGWLVSKCSVIDPMEMWWVCDVCVRLCLGVCVGCLQSNRKPSVLVVGYTFLNLLTN